MASVAPANGKSQILCPTCSAIQYSIDKLRGQLAEIEQDTAKHYKELVYTDIKSRVEQAGKIDRQLMKARMEMSKHVGKAHRSEDDV